MKKKVLLSESDLVQLIESFINEDPNPRFRSFGVDLVGKSAEEKSKDRKIDYFMQIFFPRFKEIKQVHGLDFAIELLNNLAIEIDEVNED
jgi:hypothetical protein